LANSCFQIMPPPALSGPRPRPPPCYRRSPSFFSGGVTP
jgi:hypothetical protein